MTRRIFFAFLLSCFCSFPHLAFAGTRRSSDGPIGPIEGDNSGFYASVLYDYNFSMNVGKFTGSEDAANVTTGTIYGKSPLSDPIAFSPKYNLSLLSGSAVVGYRLNDSSRIEIEGGYLRADRDTSGYSSENSAYYVELQRDGEFLCDPTTTTATCGGQPPIQLSNARSIADNKSLAFKLNNDGVTHLMFLGNLVYEFRRNRDPLFFYLGIGAGVSYTTFLESSDTHLAFQGKLGIGFDIMQKITLTLGYRYFGLLNDKFTDLNPTAVIGKYSKCVPSSTPTSCLSGTPGVSEDVLASTTATVNHPMGFNGIQIGATVQF